MAGTSGRNEGRPLYVQVRDELRERIRTGQWRPGTALPSEFEIAAELGVSQGTARKALDRLAADQLVERHQGRGTFVVEMTPRDMLFRFFHIYGDDGRQIVPDSIGARVRRGPASGQERQRLGLAKRASVIRITRVRTREDHAEPFVLEEIALPAALFPGLDRRGDLPNTLYDLFQRDYAITVARTDERITAVACGTREARRLKLAAGTPLLRVDRTTYDMADRPIEWRVSLVHLARAHYLARLR